VFLVVFLESLAVWFLGLLTVDAALQGTMHSVIIRLGLNYFTAVSVLSRLEAWELEGALGKEFSELIVDMFKNSLAFDGGVLAHLMGLECLFGMRHAESNRESAQGNSDGGAWQIQKSQTIFWVAAPCVWMVGIAVMSLTLFQCYHSFVMWRHWWKRDFLTPLRESAQREFDYYDDDEFIKQYRIWGVFRQKAVYAGICTRFKVVLSDSIPLLVISYFVILPTTLRELVVTLSCEKLGNDASEYRLLSAPDVKCWHGDHLPYAIIAIIGIVVWGVVVPGLLTFNTFHQGEELSVHHGLKTHIGWLSDGYEADFCYWEGIVHLRKLTFILIGIIPDLSRSSELALYQMTSVTAMLVHLTVKPFDNRAGQLLDEIELRGLNFFSYLVVSLQVVLLANPHGADYDLVTIFFTGGILVVSSLLLCTSLQSFEAVFKFCSAGVCGAMVALCYAENIQELREMMAFGLVVLAYSVNVFFILWMLWKITGELSELLVAQVARSSAEKLAQEEKMHDMHLQLSKDAHHPKHHDQEAPLARQPFAALAARLVTGQTTLLGRLKRLLSCANQGSGALINYDHKSGDLVLGLHPETYMHDPNLSAYSRRMLARLGPFLSDDEREFLAESIQDAIVHIIVGCETDNISVDILEFLFRYVFASHYHKKELMGEAGMMEGNNDKDQAPALVWGEQPTTKTMHTSKSKMGAKIGQMMFRDEVFKVGLSADQFMTQMNEITMMGKHHTEELLSGFLERKQADERQRDELGDTKGTWASQAPPLSDQFAAWNPPQGDRAMLQDVGEVEEEEEYPSDLERYPSATIGTTSDQLRADQVLVLRDGLGIVPVAP
jgi:hypothetical protein